MGFFDGAAGGLFSGVATLAQNAAGRRAAERDRGFQERMSNTAHQRQVKDLEAAGLNKMLSVNAGASAPSGSQANLGDFGAATNSAMDAMRLKAQLKNINADTELKEQNKELSKASTFKTAGDAKQSNAYGDVLQSMMPYINKANSMLKNSARPKERR